MISLYLTVAIFVLMVAYAGMENTIRTFAYIDLNSDILPYQNTNGIDEKENLKDNW